jgi:3-oxoacyl-[acyl-carrier protein] reductase
MAGRRSSSAVQGLGRATAEAPTAEGACIALVARNRDALDAAAQAIAHRFGAPVHAFAADLGDAAATMAAVEQAEAALGGRIDILLNNTGGPPPGLVSGTEPYIWEAQFQAMLLPMFRVTDRVLVAQVRGDLDVDIVGKSGDRLERRLGLGIG